MEYFFQDHTQHYKDIVFRAFDPVVIRLSLDATNVQREKIVFELVKPFIAGFSVEPMEIDAGDEQLPTKRKSGDESEVKPDAESQPSKTSGKKNKKSKK